MMRALILLLPLTACMAPPPRHEDPPPLKFRACQALPPPLPKVRTIEGLKARGERVELIAQDCAERLRLAVQAYDELKATRAP